MEGRNVLSPDGILWKIVFADKKVSKTQIKAFDIQSALAVIHVQNLELGKAGMVLLALAKVVSKKMKFLLDDCTSVLQIICKEKYAVVRSFRAPSSKPITLGAECSNLYINDDMLDLGDEMIVPRDELSLLENDTMLDHFDADFSNIEQVREGTLLSSSNIFPENTFVIKRRRMIEDSVAEYDLDVFRENIKCTSGIVSRQRREDIRDRLCSTLQIDSKLLSMLKIADRDVADVEAKRQSSLVDNSIDDDFLVEPAGEQTFDQGDATRESTVSEHKPFFDAANLPEDFQFDSIVGGYNRFDKAYCFISLLVMASRNEIAVEQNTAFGSIRCAVVKST